MSGEALFGLALVSLWVAFAAILYLGAGGRRLWGPRRGEPFCGHPFELTWGMCPRPTVWRCPKCRTSFELREHAGGARRWTMVR